jgi:TfoX/Sxy family transcriptional regulator of competence genes
MPYDKDIENRIKAILGPDSGVTAKAMFGGVCYLVQGHMAFGIYQDNLIIRLGSPEEAQRELDARRALPFDITGKPMKGWIMVPKERLAKTSDYKRWLKRGLTFAKSLPKKE